MQDGNSMKGRVVAVTGAGRGLGRAYALQLAAEGAAVLVNDLGSQVDGKGADASVAQAVASEIVARGGRAVTNLGDISDPSAAAEIITQAMHEFGRLDAIINNAGTFEVKSFQETEAADFERLWRVHFLGHYHVTKAAWPIFVSQNFGQVVMTGSGASLFGANGTASYSAAKGAVQGLMRVLAIEGLANNVFVNTIAPGAFSRMHLADGLSPEQLKQIDLTKKSMLPELVAPLVTWLASERCDVTGQTFSAWSGRVARVALGTGRGMIDRELSVEAIDAGYSTIAGMDQFYEPTSVGDEIEHWLPFCL
ncbi:SDR family NAD(P)-dependent oxidoreductase [Sphingobium sp. 15-1]|uniref:SDR family NAD(P)-dependent oxidoreductase n=1 Tax=Sphingobium sp. 15-1 TaxID=2729616 RepID=UPI00159C3C9F|nr:SDR family NAD(P)-dependent oxidoreductase [Sphingobium sp. 15-1]